MVSIAVGLSLIVIDPLSIDFELVFVDSFGKVDISLVAEFSSEIHDCSSFPIVPVSIELDSEFGIRTLEDNFFVQNSIVSDCNWFHRVLFVKCIRFCNQNLMRVKLIETFCRSHKRTTEFGDNANWGFLDHLSVVFICSIIMSKIINQRNRFLSLAIFDL